MEENGVFKNLAHTLGREERENLLQKLQGNSSIPDEIIVPDARKKGESDMIVYYRSLPWYKKLFYILLSIFLTKPKEEVILGRRIAELGREIDAAAPGMYDTQNGVLLSALLQYLVDLKEAARFFSSILDGGVLANYGMFLVYMGSLEMPVLHEQLQIISDPENSYKNNYELSEIKLKKKALAEAEKLINSIEEDKRQSMYNNARSLFCIKELAYFLFDRLILGFQTSSNPAHAGQICPFSLAKAQLCALNNMLFSFKRMPSMSLLSSMYIFVMQHEHRSTAFDNEREMQRFTSGAEKALLTMRNFAARVPLSRIIRCGMRDLSYEPSEISGSEEWFSVFRDKWLSLINANFNDFILSRKRRELSEALAEFFNGEELESFEGTKDGKYPDGIPIKGETLLSFLFSFHKHIFMGGMNNVLRPILIDGEFNKHENRIVFTESYNEILKIDDLIIAVQKKIRPSGEWGQRWKQMNGEVQSLAVRHRKIGLFMEEVNGAIGHIIHTSKESLAALTSIIGGILKPDPAGKYDTLSNYAKIAGKGNEFTDELIQVHKDVAQASHLIEVIEQLEEEE
jgi:hypothetical protein